jgi:VanZ family protein
MNTYSSGTGWETGIIKPSFLIVAACVLVVIVHGSLFPYAFHENGGISAAVRTLLESWNRPPSGFPDFVANFLLYVPLGLFGTLAIRARFALPVVVLIGLALSTAIELAQFFDAGRVTNMSDVYLNTAGTLLGGVLAIRFDLWMPERVARAIPIEPVPSALLAVFVVYRLYPYVPTIDVHKYWHSVRPVITHQDLGAWPVFKYFVLWLTVSYLVTALRSASAWKVALLFAAIVFAAKVVVVDLALSASEMAGAALAFFLWFGFLGRSHAGVKVLFALLGAAVVAFRLLPFHFHASATPFGWIPFRSMLRGSLGVDLVASVEKAFLYSSLIWIGTRAGMKLWVSTSAVAFILLITSLLETHLPGRSAESTDCVMALLLGGGLGALGGLTERNKLPPAPARSGGSPRYPSSSSSSVCPERTRKP